MVDWDKIDKAFAHDQEAIAELSIDLADTKSDLLALVRYHKAYVGWEDRGNSESLSVDEFLKGYRARDTELKAAKAALSDRVKRMLSDD